MPQYPTVIVGNLTEDPELKKTPSGDYYARMRIASSRSYRDAESKEWKDTDQLYITAVAWGQLATNAAQSLSKGMGVLAGGRLVTYEWDEQDFTGNPIKRQKIELKIDRLGLDLTKYVASVSATNAFVHEVDGVPAPNRPDPEKIIAEQERRAAASAAGNSNAFDTASDPDSGDQSSDESPF